LQWVPAMASAETEWNKEIERVSIEPLIMKIILLIEDNSVAALRLGEMFAQRAGYQVIVASDCKAALKFMRSCRPDLILLNEGLLMSHGIDFGHRLFMMKDLQKIPLLLHGAALH
jgi:DNA-binding response OmpR family regulator